MLTGAQVVVGGRRPEARQRHARPARHGQARHRHQGQHHHRRRRRELGRREGPDQPDQGRDRQHRLGLGPREAPGAAGQAVGRRRRHQGRRGHRGRAEGEEAPHRGRRLGDQGGHRGGCRRRWRRGPHPGPQGGAPRSSRRSTATRRPAPARCGSRWSRRPGYIAENAGLEGSVWVQRVEAEEGAIGLNAETGELTDLIKAGIVDPAKVTRAALQNAASIAAMVLTTEAVGGRQARAPGSGHARRRRRHGRHARDDVSFEGEGDLPPSSPPSLWSSGRPASRIGLAPKHVSRAGTGTALSRDCMSVRWRETIGCCDRSGCTNWRST